MILENNESIVAAKKLPQYLAAIAVTGGALVAGTIYGWSSPTELRVLDRPNDANFTSEYTFQINDEEWSWISSLVTLGSASIVLVIGFIINLMGRKMMMLMLIIPSTIGWSLCIWAINVEMLYVGRFLLGFASSSFFTVGPMYIGEIAEKEIRGKLGTFVQLMVTIGILFVYCLGYAANVYTYSIICGVIPILHGIIILFLPESPLYLILKNRPEEAVRSLKWLRGTDYDFREEMNELHLQNIMDNVLEIHCLF